MSKLFWIVYLVTLLVSMVLRHFTGFENTVVTMLGFIMAKAIIDNIKESEDEND